MRLSLARTDGKVGERTLLKDFVGVGNWRSYIAEMSQHGRTWGDEATLLAASVRRPRLIGPRLLGPRLLGPHLMGPHRAGPCPPPTTSAPDLM